MSLKTLTPLSTLKKSDELGTLKLSSLLRILCANRWISRPNPFVCSPFIVSFYNLKTTRFCSCFSFYVFSQSLAIHFVFLSLLLHHFLGLLLTISEKIGRGRDRILVNSINLSRKPTSMLIATTASLENSSGNPNYQFFNNSPEFESCMKKIPRTSNGYGEGSLAFSIDSKAQQ